MLLSFSIYFVVFDPWMFVRTSYKAYPGDPSDSTPIGVIVCKQSTHKDSTNRGYIAMLSVSKNWRKRGIGS